jgi:hypothetical protein
MGKPRGALDGPTVGLLGGSASDMPRAIHGRHKG